MTQVEETRRPGRVWLRRSRRRQLPISLCRRCLCRRLQRRLRL